RNGGKPPLLLPLSLLAAAFILNGAFCSGWKPASLVFGFAEAAVYFLLFYLFYYGLKGESINRLIDYVCYTALLSSFIIIGELAFLYITNDAVIADGFIHKDAISLGWGISNPIGCALVMLVPLLMLGAIRCKYTPVYLCAMFLTCAATFFTLSRNAIVVCLLVLTASILVAYFMSNLRKILGITVACGMGAVLLVALIFNSQIGELLRYFSGVGSADNGRFILWKQSFENFLSAPIFGRGFFDWGEMDVYEVASFVPTMAHNTFFQLMSSMGIFGLGSYIFYRIRTVMPFFKNISREKLLIFLSVAALLLGSLLDNFVFYFQSVFLYVILLALVFHMSEYEQNWTSDNEWNEDDEGDEDKDEDEDEDDDGTDTYYA
ncbi:MAG: O-antigen ligase family protein, partial [Clostridia bacterium]|nr:O-antigen ligase family protein [Clostridia bacterium]